MEGGRGGARWEEGVTFKMEIEKHYRRPLERLIGEGVRIMNPGADILMNGKLDHYRPAVGKISISNVVNSGRTVHSGRGGRRRNNG